MPVPAYERHLQRAQSLLTSWMQGCARELAGEVNRYSAADLGVRLLRAEVSDAVARHHGALAAGWRDALERGLREPPVSGGRRGRVPDLEELQIMDDSRVQEEIEVALAARVLAADCGQELHRLLRFESALRRSEGVVVTVSPVGPAALARAVWQGSERLRLGPPARAEAVRAAARWMAARLSDVYLELLNAGDDSATRALQEADSNAASVVDDEFAPSSGFDVTRPGALLDLLDAPGTDLDTQPADLGTPTGPPTLAETQPMPMDGDDPRIPDLIHRHRGELAALQGQASPGAVLSLITRLFDQILADPTLPPEARHWIGRLQPSVVALASTDATLLQTHRHPAWTFINRLATQMSTSDEPASPEFLNWLAGTLAHVSSHPGAGAFEDACNRLAQWRRVQAHRRLTDAQAPLELLRRNATLEAQVTAARARLQRKLDSARSPAATTRFVQTLWALVCAQESSTREGPPPGRPSAFDVASDLIWSTDGARTKADSPTLLAMMPILVEQLTYGLATIGVTAAHRDAWLDQLATLHVKALQRTTGLPVAGGPVTVDLKLDDELPVGRGDDEEPETAPMTYAGTTAPASPAAPDPLADLQVGDGLGMQLDGEWVDVQLLWMSDNGQFLLFASERGGRSHSFTRRALQRMKTEGLVRAFEGRSALERATDGIVRRRG